MPRPTRIPNGTTEKELRWRAAIAVRLLGYPSLRDFTIAKWMEAIDQTDRTIKPIKTQVR